MVENENSSNNLPSAIEDTSSKDGIETAKNESDLTIKAENGKFWNAVTTVEKINSEHSAEIKPMGSDFISIASNADAAYNALHLAYDKISRVANDINDLGSIGPMINRQANKRDSALWKYMVQEGLAVYPKGPIVVGDTWSNFSDNYAKEANRLMNLKDSGDETFSQDSLDKALYNYAISKEKETAK